MSEPENFIARWSRRKHEAAQEVEAAKPPGTPEPTAEGSPTDADSRRGDAAAPARADTSEPPQSAFDPEQLPPIESISADSDIRAFLRPGVPPELTRAALRRAWAADPRIRDFVGLADYDWDFNTPGAIPGFGVLEPSEELRQQVARMLGRGLAAGRSEEPSPAPPEVPEASPSIETSKELRAATAGTSTQLEPSDRGTPGREPDNTGSDLHNSQTIPQRGKENIALQSGTESPNEHRSAAKRSHGSALPK